MSGSQTSRAKGGYVSIRRPGQETPFHPGRLRPGHTGRPSAACVSRAGPIFFFPKPACWPPKKGNNIGSKKFDHGPKRKFFPKMEITHEESSGDQNSEMCPVLSLGGSGISGAIGTVISNRSIRGTATVETGGCQNLGVCCPARQTGFRCLSRIRFRVRSIKKFSQRSHTDREKDVLHTKSRTV
jgi:hypothetical protein